MLILNNLLNFPYFFPINGGITVGKRYAWHLSNGAAKSEI
jgi:hypothetical protein